MHSVTYLAQFLLRLDPPKNLARLAFYHYVKNWIDPEQPIVPAHLDDFFDRCLSFDYWVDHAGLLGETVRKDLEAFCSSAQLPFDFSATVWPEQRQIVIVADAKELEAIGKLNFETKIQRGDQIRYLSTADHQLMVLWLKTSGELEVQGFRNAARIYQGQLKLLAPATHLLYGPQLDLLPHRRMIVAGPLTSSFVFEMSDRGFKGLTTRGHSFQKMDAFTGSHVSQCPELFYSLKKIEKHFIKPESDPFYQELISLLEKSYQLISAGEYDSERLAETALAKGRLALKNIFPNDKLILLLVTNIEYWLIQRRKEAPAPPASL